MLLEQANLYAPVSIKTKKIYVALNQNLLNPEIQLLSEYMHYLENNLQNRFLKFRVNWRKATLHLNLNKYLITHKTNSHELLE